MVCHMALGGFCMKDPIQGYSRSKNIYIEFSYRKLRFRLGFNVRKMKRAKISIALVTNLSSGVNWILIRKVPCL